MKEKVNKGKCIISTDKEYLADIKTKTLNEYLDIKPILDEGLKIKKSAGYRAVV